MRHVTSHLVWDAAARQTAAAGERSSCGHILSGRFYIIGRVILKGKTEFMGSILQQLLSFATLSSGQVKISAEAEHLGRLSDQLDCHIECLHFLYKTTQASHPALEDDLAIPKFRVKLLTN